MNKDNQIDEEIKKNLISTREQIVESIKKLAEQTKELFDAYDSLIEEVFGN